MVVTTFAVELLESDEVGPVVEASEVVVASLVDVGVVEESVDELSEVDVDESDVEVGVDSADVEVDSEVEADSVSELDEDSVVVAGLELDITISPISPTMLLWPAVTATRDREYKKNEREATRMMDER